MYSIFDLHMSQEEKKALLLLKSVIFHYHGLDEDEQALLEADAKAMDAEDALVWVSDFIAEDYLTAFSRANTFFANTIAVLSEERKTSILSDVWRSNQEKGYITEMEATAMLKLAKEWQIEMSFMQSIKSN